jgi:hypothetical protein
MDEINLQYQGYDSAAALTQESIDLIKRKQRSFVCRYLNNLPNCHDGLTIREAKIISNCGLSIVSIYKAKYNIKADSLDFKQGETDARSAIMFAKQIRQPENTPIYFAIDCDIGPETYKQHAALYIEGLLSVFNIQKNESKGYIAGICAYGYVCSEFRGNYSASIRPTFTIGNTQHYSEPKFSGWNILQNAWGEKLSNGISVNCVTAITPGGGGWKATDN